MWHLCRPRRCTVRGWRGGTASRKLALFLAVCLCAPPQLLAQDTPQEEGAGKPPSIIINTTGEPIVVEPNRRTLIDLIEDTFRGQPVTLIMGETLPELIVPRAEKVPG
jgi:hypothetical protein